MWIMCQNVGEISERNIRLIGESKKIDKIGRFGSGLKEAIALALRLKIDLIIMSGTVRYEFFCSDGEILYRVGDRADGVDRVERFNLSIDFGKHDWMDPWQVFREVFCNAYDEGGLYHEVVGDITGVRGATRVYLRGSAQLFEHYGLADRRLRFDMAEGAESNGYGDIYCKGVWVRTLRSVFNWNLPELKLSESRTADLDDIKGCVGKRLTWATVDVARTLLENYCGDNFEWESILWAKTSNYHKAATGLWGANYAIAFPFAEEIEAGGVCGANMIIVQDGDRYEAMRRLGLRTMRDFLRDRGQDICDVVEVHNERATRLWSLIGRGVCPRILKYKSVSTSGCFVRGNDIYTENVDDVLVLVRLSELSMQSTGKVLGVLLDEINKCRL